MSWRWTWVLWTLQLVPRIGSLPSEDEVCTLKGCQQAEFKDTNPEGYFWRRRAGSREIITSVPYNAPVKLSEPAWVWPNAGDEQVRHSPLIDHEKNIYVMTYVTLRKFTEHGALLWEFTTGLEDGPVTTSPALDHGAVYILASNRARDTLTMICLSMTTGQLMWKRLMPKSTMNADAHSLLVYNDTILFPTRKHLSVDVNLGNEGDAGNDQVRAVRQSDGADLWTFTVDAILWNLIVSTPGDGTMFFSSTCGTVYRIDWEGKLVWQSGRPPKRYFCGCAGGVLGENGIFYAEWNVEEFQHSGVSAHRASDGKLLWERVFPIDWGGWQYPAVGRLAPHGRLAVVAMMGGITGWPRLPGYDWMPLGVREFIYSLYLNFRLVRKLMGAPDLPLKAEAMDADTGQTLWTHEEEPWDHIAAIGDEEPFLRRWIRANSDPTRRSDLICLPDTAGIPVISADGTVYVSSSHTGTLTTVRDEDGNGIIDVAREVTMFKTNQTFLNSPSLAPGMVVAAPCWGPMYVFKDNKLMETQA